MRDGKRRRPTQKELRAMGATPGRMIRKIGGDGRTSVRQITREAKKARRGFPGGPSKKR